MGGRNVVFRGSLPRRDEKSLPGADGGGSVRAAVLGLALLCSALAGGQEPFQIGQVTIRALDVFSPEEAARGWLYRAADALHIETRESVIRKFLLFAEGDVYNPTRLEETERNLRALPFLKSASVTAGPPHDGVVDVEVVTQDAWTTEPGISFGGKGGTTTYAFDLKEKDFLGTGRQVAVAYARGTERIIRLVQYKDPYLFGPYWNGNFTYLYNSDGAEARVRINRPFFSFIDPWSTDFFFSNLQQNDRLFQGGEPSARFRRKHRELQLQYGRAVEATDRRARRLTAGFQWLEDVFSHAPRRPEDILPEDRRFRTVFLQYEEVQNDFLKLNYVNRDVRYEDFNLGRSLLARVGISPAVFGAPRTTEFLRLEAEQGWRLGAGSFLQAQLALGTRFQGGPRNAILSGSLTYVRKLDTRMLQTFLSRLQYDQGWNLDRDVQFFADGGTGLRGYRLHAFEGNKRIIWNAEHRLFSGREFFQLISPGAVVFFDTGTAVPPGQPLRLADFKSDVGLGLRFSISRAASNSVLRIDGAYALNRDARGRRGFLVSFSSGQVF